MKLDYKKANFLALLGIILWVVLIIIAMFTYTGGTKDNPSIIGYSFWGNTFSDMGRTTAWSGIPNIISMTLFSFAYGICAITLIPFYLSFKNLFSNKRLESKVSKLGSYLGILSSIAIIGIVFTPADIANLPHWVFVFIAYPSVFLMGTLYSVALIKSDKFSKYYGYAIAILTLIFLVSILVGLVGIVYSHAIMVIGQKISRIALLIALTVLIYSSWKLE